MTDDTLTRHDAAAALAAARARLASARGPVGHWEGHLSASALSTAIALFALQQVGDAAHTEFVTRGRRWITDHQNADGGWGDTLDSPSNLSTTLLCLCALGRADADSGAPDARAAAEGLLRRELGSIEPREIVAALLRFYGKDRTFSTPILMMCALGGRLGDDDPWRAVPQLPFELALCPRGLLKWLKLSVVSYALPALIAIGLARHRRSADADPLTGRLRDWITPRVLRVLERMQPSNGGFLEAAPLTGFVVMGLAAAGHRDHAIVAAGTRFLVSSVREDGSWPIDTNLATWVSTQSVWALAGRAVGAGRAFPAAESMVDWLLGQQFSESHPFTGAAAGGWGWTDRPGAVPDADDTAGALLALRRLRATDDGDRLAPAAARGIQWLLGLQNNDGGLPTFCRGWGKLPFDRSCPDITAHALSAFDQWYDEQPSQLRSAMDRAMHLSLDYLAAAQHEDGSWTPLWFGNQHAAGGENRAFGTARVVGALQDITPDRLPRRDVLVERGRALLLAEQNGDGGWGGQKGAPSTVEETALAVYALADGADVTAVDRGIRWLVETTRGGTVFPAAPIGLYFSSLWYAEELYPLIFTVAALDRAVSTVSCDEHESVGSPTRP